MAERLVGELICQAGHIGEYIAIRAHRLENGMIVGKRIACGIDPEEVHGAIREDMKKTIKAVQYYFYKPGKVGEDREGWVINPDEGRFA